MANQKSDFEVQVTHIVGDSFVSTSRNEGEKPIPLVLGDKFKRTSPFAILVAKGSYAEMTLQTEAILRIGQQSVIEFRNPNYLRIFNGSALLLLSKQQSLNLETNGIKIQLTGRGTLMFESPKGKNLKIIMLEGKALLSSAKAKQSLQAGELVLVQAGNPDSGQTINVDLPLLLATSRLINNFSAPLPSQSKLISAAKVQAVRLKKRYEALIGNTNDQNQLRLWALRKEERQLKE
ncbi:MAG: hypothetical protein VXX29_10345 [Verrucomicrobiota bacterium]|nr:hypothetical protein [Verrucomicrobiota bacterium]